MRSLRLHVDGMGCRHCVRRVSAWLRDVPGVETVAVDPHRGVVVTGTMSAADVVATVESAYRVEVMDGAWAADSPDAASMGSIWSADSSACSCGGAGRAPW